MLSEKGKKGKAGEKHDETPAKSAGSKKSGKDKKDPNSLDINEEDYIPIEKKAEIGTYGCQQTRC